MSVDYSDSKASMGSTPPSRHALLIASPWRDLQGPINDIDAVSELLGQYNFNMKQLRGAVATRDNIIQEWHSLISRLKKYDIAVVYYSGHGGLLKAESSASTYASTACMPDQYQFIVPMDYSADPKQEFRGILDVEMSVLLQRMTDITKNVTIIMDCCHSGRMVRDPRHGNNAVPKAVPRLQVGSVQELAAYVSRLQETMPPQLRGQTSPEGNTYAVRVMTAADNETAFEYDDERGKRVGALTKALMPSLEEALFAAATIGSGSTGPFELTSEHLENAGVTWESLMLRVRQLVNAEFANQHPQVEGPHQRIVFSRHTKNSSALLVVQEGDEMVIQAGEVAGVRKNDLYAIMPAGHQRIDEGEKLGEARVTDLSGFRATVCPETSFCIPADGALAFIKEQAEFKQPVEISKELQDHESVEKSKLVRPATESDGGMVIARIYKEDGCISLYSNSKFKVGSYPEYSMEEAIDGAEKIARAKRFLGLTPPKEERLAHTLEYTLSTVSHEIDVIATNGTGNLEVGSKAVIELHNPGNIEIFISVFDVNVTGKVGHLSAGWAGGIRLPSGGRYKLGQMQHAAFFGNETRTTRGLEMSWPKNLPDDAGDEAPEDFVFVVSDGEVDVRYFANVGRDCQSERVLERVKWDVVRLPFKLVKRST